MHRIQRDRRLTAEEVENLRVVRENAAGEIAEAAQAMKGDLAAGYASVEDVLEVRRLVAALRAERQRQSVSLADLARRSLLDVSALEELEGNRQSNPTLSVLARYARALGASLRLELSPGGDAVQHGPLSSGATEGKSDRLPQPIDLDGGFPPTVNREQV